MHNAKWMLLAMAVTSMVTTGPAVSRTISYTYNGSGQLTSIDGARTDVPDITNYTYDNQGNLTAIINALGQVILFTAYNSHGQPLSMTDANGVVTTFEYDIRQRLIRRTEGGRTTLLTYDPVGNLIRITQPDLSHLEYDYDAARRLVGISDNLGNRVRYTLDAAGNRLSEEVLDPQGDLALLRRQSFDALSRLRIRLGAGGEATQFGHDPAGNLLMQIDPLQRRTGHVYDALNRPVETLDPANGRTEFSYDAQDRLTRVVDPRGVTTIYRYNAFGNLLEEGSPDAGIRTFTYDEAGNRLTETDARGITRTFSYDALNRLTNIRYPDPSEDVRFLYDQGAYATGRLSAIEEPSGRIEYEYNVHGEVVAEVRHVGELRFETRYDYDPHGRITAMHYPGGATLRFDHDSAGRSAGVTLYHDNATTRLADGISYSPFGAMTGVRLGNGLHVERDFDLDGRLQAIRAGSVLNLDLAYDPVSNITALTDLLNASQSQAFDYDELDRLVYALGAYGYRDYTYDPVGNRLIRESDSRTQEYAYAIDSNRLTGLSDGLAPRQYLHDANGNTADDGQFAYTYNQANRLARVSRLSVEQARYTHNALGQRIRKTLPGGGSSAGQRAEAEQRLAFHEAESTRLKAVADEYRVAFEAAEAQARAYDAEAQTARQAAEEAEADAESLSQLAQSHEAQSERLRLMAAQFRVLLSFAETSGASRSYIATLKRVIADHDRLSGHYHQMAEEARDETKESDAWAAELRAQAEEADAQAAVFLDEADRLRTQEEGARDETRYHTEQAAYWAQRLSDLEDDPTSPAGQETHFVYDLEGRLIGEYDPDGAPIREYVYLEGTPFAMLHEGKIYYYHADHLGTPRRMTASDQRIVWDTIQSPFGTMMLLTEEIENPLRFPGQYHDPETGLHYNYFRTYDPSLGRYIISDPIGLNGGLNTYAYVFANSLRYTDFFGLAVECTWVVTDYYDKVTPVLVQPEVRSLNEVCYPVPTPTIEIPNPTSPRRRPDFPNPFDISFQMRCVREWIVTQEAEWDFSVDRWMKGYMRCTDTCTGEVTNHWSPDRIVVDPPRIQ